MKNIITFFENTIDRLLNEPILIGLILFLAIGVTVSTFILFTAKEQPVNGSCVKIDHNTYSRIFYNSDGKGFWVLILSDKDTLQTKQAGN